MKKYIPLFVFGIIFLAVAFLSGMQYEKSVHTDEHAKEEQTTHTHDHNMNTNNETSKTSMHTHTTLKLDNSKSVPTATIEVIKDKMSGYNLNISVKDFNFVPRQVNGEIGVDAQNNGHAHLFINGEKITRIYSTDFYISDKILKPGDKVNITLNANDHSEIVKSNTIEI